MQITLKRVFLAALPLAGVLFFQAPASADNDWGRYGGHRHSYSRGDHCDSPRKFHSYTDRTRYRSYRDMERARRYERFNRANRDWRRRYNDDDWRYGQRNYDDYDWRSNRRNYDDYYRGSQYNGYPYYNGGYYGSSVPGGVLGLPGAIVGSVVPPLMDLPNNIYYGTTAPLLDALIPRY